MAGGSKKTTSKRSSRGRRQPNTTSDRTIKTKARGKGTRSQSNQEKVAGVSSSGAKNLHGKNRKKLAKTS